MTRRHFRIAQRFAPGLSLLVLATSCVPVESAPFETRAVAARLPTTVGVLRRLALHVPDDVARFATADLSDIRFDDPVSAAPPFDGLDRTGSPGDAARATQCLTAAIYYEARSQSDDGQRAVAQVVLNRVRDRAFPDSVCGVVYQGSHRATGCQFSFTCDGSMAFRRDAHAWAHAQDIATAALSGAVYAPVGSATFYHADYVQPWWASSMDQVATVGAHIFYRWRGRLEGALAFRQAYSGIEPAVSGRTTPVDTDVAAASPFAETVVMSGVRVHRGLVPAATSPAPAAPLPEDRPRVARASVTTMGGVRIHRGATPAAMAAAAPGVSSLD